MRRLAPYLLAAWALLWAGWVAAPYFEARFRPIRVEQEIQVVERGSRLCWVWHSTKLRAVASDDIDVHLVVGGDWPNRYSVAVFNRDTGMPWSRSGAMGVGTHDLPFCVLLPPHVTDRDDLVVEQTAWFPGWLGLWRVPLVIPPVTSRGAKP
ncbi:MULTISPECIES: hypothetical protein [unclassified Methylobacterium]|uniref:hypothetical protein n=1 Tax=unclassified Methylobacterium TaxID=2615210 RepID=UPI001352B17F|nr:hypothetical protein [Methylobacterium sp. 2A]MWV22434.1 hypothetical protein [Methylobacterium sp. 2A]